MKTCALVITAYNSKDFLLQTLESLKKQLLPSGWNIKIYIGVDGCKETASWLDENKISYYYSNNNVGTYILTNSLLCEAKKDNCDIFVRFDSDDVACENFLMYGIEHVLKFNFIRPFQLPCNEHLIPLKENPELAHGSMFITKKALDDLGGYYHYRVGCDTNFYRRAEACGHNGKIFNNFPVYLYRQHSNSLMKNKEFGKGTTYRKSNRDLMEFELQNGILKIENPVVTELLYYNYSKSR
jgi:glycosyltransferase involved in cell wall biosynthesis